MASLIEDTELIQGDSSDIFFFGLPDSSDLTGGDWVAQYTILTEYGATPSISRNLLLNDGNGEGDSYAPGSKFVFQIIPDESATLTVGVKYIVNVEIKNDTIPYKGEVAQYKMKIKPQGVV